MVKLNSLFHFLKNNPWWPFLGLALVIYLAYRPGLNGPYVFDDGENILLNPSVALTHLTYENLITAFMSNDSGPLKRPIAATSFALTHYFNSGFYPTFAFKATNLVIHFLNTCLLYFLCLKLLETPRLKLLLDNNSRRVVALSTVALWALHPIQLTNILYVVQRMNSLSALFVLGGLIIFVQGRSLLNATDKNGFPLMVVGLLGGMGLGLASKENAALLPLFALVIEYTLYGFKTRNQQNRRHLMWFYALLVVLPIISLATYLATYSNLIVDSYLTRPFSPLERILSETRILWFYVGLILLPISQRFSLFHDDIILSTSLFAPITTLAALIGLVIALGVAIAQTKRHPVISFAILWFLTGHALESGILGLELAHEHRNYLPSFGIIFAVTFALIIAIKQKHRAFLLVFAGIFLTFGLVTWTRANIWSDVNSLAEHTVRTHPNSPSANDFAARTSLGVNHDTAAALRYTLAGLRLAPHEVGFHLDLQILFSSVAAEIARTMPESRIRSAGENFPVHITGMNENIQALKTKDGLLLSQSDSSPEKISVLLATKPITAHGIFSLENLRHCILDPPRSCVHLHNLGLTWFRIAAKNSRVSRDYRAIVLSNVAMLYADNGDFTSALEYMHQATAVLPERVSYRIARAEYLIRGGHLDEAKRAIDFIVAEPIPTDTPASMHELNIRKLKALYDKASSETRITRTPRK